MKRLALVIFTGGGILLAIAIFAALNPGIMDAIRGFFGELTFQAISAIVIIAVVSGIVVFLQDAIKKIWHQLFPYKFNVGEQGIPIGTWITCGVLVTLLVFCVACALGILPLR